MAKSSQPFEKIGSIGNQIEAQVLQSVLTEHEIPFRIRSFHDTAYDGLFQFQKGWGELYAPSEYKDEIVEIIVNIRKGDKGSGAS